ncbi:MAG: phasin family protein [Usitatibacter sp.]
MKRKAKSSSQSTQGPNETADAIRGSAQKIWLAGLGAFARAKTDGPRMFEALVEQGRSMGARAVGAADDALKNIREANYGGAQWGKLEQVFEDRVSKSLGRLGVLTARDVEALSRQVNDLNETVRKLKSAAGGTRGTKGGKKAAPKKHKAKSKAKRATPG